jgi:hypothetical protein
MSSSPVAHFENTRGQTDLNNLRSQFSRSFRRDVYRYFADNTDALRERLRRNGQLTPRAERQITAVSEQAQRYLARDLAVQAIEHALARRRQRAAAER